MTTFRTLIMAVFVLLLTISSAYAVSPASNSTLPPSNSVGDHYAKVNGVRLHYIEMGKGPLIILLHGWPETSFAWNHTMSVLSQQYRVVAPDLRGLGLSERTKTGYDKKTVATDIKALVEQLGEKQAVIIGHDMGGKVAYTMAHLYPQTVSKLVLVDCLIPGTENADALHGGAWHYGFHMAPDIPEMLTQGRERDYIRAQIKTWSFKKDAVSEDAISEYARHYATEGGMTAGFNYYRALKEDAALAATFRNQKLPMPVLTISGRHGVGEQLPKALANETVSLKTIIVEDSGHFVAEEAPEAFNSAVISFLKSNSSAGSTA